MTAVKPLHEFAKYASLSVLAMIALSCYILADTFFVSLGLGTRGLAALNLAIPAYNFIHGTRPDAGHGRRHEIFHSEKPERRPGSGPDVHRHPVPFPALFCVLRGDGTVLFRQPGPAAGGRPGSLFHDGHVPESAAAVLPGFLSSTTCCCALSATTEIPSWPWLPPSPAASRISFWTTYLFSPAAWESSARYFATGLAPVIGILVMAPHWLKRDKGFHLIPTGLQARAAGITLSLGFPSLLAQLSSGIVMILFNTIILGLLGNTGVAAYGVVANISLVVTSIFTGIAQGVQPLISRAYGRKETVLVEKHLKYSLVSMAVFSTAVYLLLFMFASLVAAVFNSEQDPALQRIAVDGLRLYFTSTLFTGFNIILSTWFGLRGKGPSAQIVSLLRGLVLIIPAAFLMAFLWGMTGVWLALTAAEFLTAAAGLFFYCRNKNFLYGTRH